MNQHNQTRPTPPMPRYCRQCKSELEVVSKTALGYDTYTSKPRTTKYLFGCESDKEHTRLVVLDNPAENFRAVIREDRYDESRER